MVLYVILCLLTALGSAIQASDAASRGSRLKENQIGSATQQLVDARTISQDEIKQAMDAVIAEIDAVRTARTGNVLREIAAIIDAHQDSDPIAMGPSESTVAKLTRLLTDDAKTTLACCDYLRTNMDKVLSSLDVLHTMFSVSGNFSHTALSIGKNFFSRAPKAPHIDGSLDLKTSIASSIHYSENFKSSLKPAINTTCVMLASNNASALTRLTNIFSDEKGGLRKALDTRLTSDDKRGEAADFELILTALKKYEAAALPKEHKRQQALETAREYLSATNGSRLFLRWKADDLTDAADLYPLFREAARDASGLSQNDRIDNAEKTTRALEILRDQTAYNSDDNILFFMPRKDKFSAIVQRQFTISNNHERLKNHILLMGKFPSLRVPITTDQIMASAKQNAKILFNVSHGTRFVKIDTMLRTLSLQAPLEWLNKKESGILDQNHVFFNGKDSASITQTLDYLSACHRLTLPIFNMLTSQQGFAQGTETDVADSPIKKWGITTSPTGSLIVKKLMYASKLNFADEAGQLLKQSLTDSNEKITALSLLNGDIVSPANIRIKAANLVGTLANSEELAGLDLARGSVEKIKERLLTLDKQIETESQSYRFTQLVRGVVRTAGVAVNPTAAKKYYEDVLKLLAVAEGKRVDTYLQSEEEAPGVGASPITASSTDAASSSPETDHATPPVAPGESIEMRPLSRSQEDAPLHIAADASSSHQSDLGQLPTSPVVVPEEEPAEEVIAGGAGGRAVGVTELLGKLAKSWLYDGVDNPWAKRNFVRNYILTHKGVNKKIIANMIQANIRSLTGTRAEEILTGLVNELDLIIKDDGTFADGKAIDKQLASMEATLPRAASRSGIGRLVGNQPVIGSTDPSVLDVPVTPEQKKPQHPPLPRSTPSTLPTLQPVTTPIPPFASDDVDAIAAAPEAVITAIPFRLLTDEASNLQSDVGVSNHTTTRAHTPPVVEREGTTAQQPASQEESATARMGIPSLPPSPESPTGEDYPREIHADPSVVKLGVRALEGGHQPTAFIAPEAASQADTYPEPEPEIPASEEDYTLGNNEALHSELAEPEAVNQGAPEETVSASFEPQEKQDGQHIQPVTANVIEPQIPSSNVDIEQLLSNRLSLLNLNGLNQAQLIALRNQLTDQLLNRSTARSPLNAAISRIDEQLAQIAVEDALLQPQLEQEAHSPASPSSRRSSTASLLGDVPNQPSSLPRTHSLRDINGSGNPFNLALQAGGFPALQQPREPNSTPLLLDNQDQPNLSKFWTPKRRLGAVAGVTATAGVIAAITAMVVDQVKKQRARSKRRGLTLQPLKRSAKRRKLA